MKSTSITKMPDTFDDAPRLTQADIDHARLRVAGKDMSRAEWCQSSVRTRIGKQRINIMLDAPIIEHFKAVTGERGYQTIINNTLRRVSETGILEADLRRIIREKFAQHSLSGAGISPTIQPVSRRKSIEINRV